MGQRAIPLIMTRPDGTNAAFVDLLSMQARDSVDVIVSPLTEIVPLDQNVRLAAQDSVIFTSMNGVRFAPKALGRVAYCVGRNTTSRARAAGWNAVCAGLNADALVEKVMDLRPSGQIVHLSGEHTRGQIAQRLCAAGLSVQHLALYEQRLLPLSEPARMALMAYHTGQIALVPLFSPRGAEQFCAQAPDGAKARFAALSPAVADAIAGNLPVEVEIAEVPEAQALANRVEKIIQLNRLG